MAKISVTKSEADLILFAIRGTLASEKAWIAGENERPGADQADLNAAKKNVKQLTKLYGDLMQQLAVQR